MKTWLSFCVLLALISCGQISYQPASDDATESLDPDSNISDLPSHRVFVFATDYQSSGQLYTATYEDTSTALSNSDLTMLGTEAKIKWHDNLLYILHAGAGFNSISTDNLQIVDPYNTQAPFSTLAQYTTGNGTNPQDVVLSDQKAFISLYNPKNDPSNVDAEGHPGDVIEMDTESGQITHRYSFYDDLADDGDRNAHASQMVLADDVLYVCLQDLESNTFSATAPGKIGMIDTKQNEMLGIITLQSRNPYGIALDNAHTRLFITSTYDYQHQGSYGGLEIVNLDSQQTELFIKDDVLGGYVERIRLSDEHAYAVISQFDLETFEFQSKLVAFPLGITTADEITNFSIWGTDIRDIFYQQDTLWVSYRVISTTEGADTPMIKLFDTNTEEQLGETLYPLVAGVSLAGEE
ncbi:MAG TPA: hypothetical protein VJC18_00315 [bacterium]|nr:hypothetical protein [bacterium]